MWTVQAAGAALALVAPGLLVLRLVPHSLSRLEAGVVALAMGRILLACGALLLSGSPTLAALWIPFSAAVALWLILAARARRLPEPVSRTVLLWLCLVLGIGAWVVQAVVGRSGLPDGSGTLIFFGHHTTNDPLVYLAMSRRIAEVGWPVDNPFVAGLPNLGHGLWFGEIVGLRALSGASWLDVAFRIRPHLDVASLGLTAFALARALGARNAGAGLGALLLLLGGGLSQPILLGLLAVGIPVGLHEVWGFGTGFHLPFNPIAPGLQTAFAALLLLARVRPEQRSVAVLAGLLVAALFEIKLFLWPSLLGGLVVASLLSAGSRRRPALVAAGVAILASVPLVIQKLLFARELRELPGLAYAGFGPCLGCLPRFALATVDPTPATVEPFAGGLDPGLLLSGIASSALWVVLLLGAKWLALPKLWQGCRGEAPTSLVYRVIAAAAVLGLGAACGLTAPPHPVNVAQFAWSASFGLWPVLAVTLGSWLARSRGLGLARVAGAVLMALPSGLFFLVSQGAAAPVFLRVPLAEQQAMELLAERVAPSDGVLEPSVLQHDSLLSPVAWLAGRQVLLSHRGAGAYLTADEQALRLGWIHQVFQSPDARRVGESLEQSGVGWVWAPQDRPLRVAPGALEVQASGAAGTLYRVGEGLPTAVLRSSP